ncbi:MAG: glycosyltransferase family 2 protein [Candidatus Lokiarchaeia archaeon]
MKTLDLKNEKIQIVKSKEIKKKPKIEKYQSLYDYIEKVKVAKGEIPLSIILPVFNEEHIVYSVLDNLPEHELIEIIVVDDHSIDNSVKKIEEIKKEKNIKLIKLNRNKGYGGAIITGIKAAKGNILLTMDSDGQHNPLDILLLIKPVFEGEADMTIGSRYLGGSYYDIPIVTRLGEALIEKLIHILFNIKVMNNQNGFRAFNGKLVPLSFNIRFQDFAFPTEFILEASLKGYRIKECPVKLYHRQFGSSKVNLSKLTLNLFSCILLYFMKKIKLSLVKRKKRKD